MRQTGGPWRVRPSGLLYLDCGTFQLQWKAATLLKAQPSAYISHDCAEEWIQIQSGNKYMVEEKRQQQAWLLSTKRQQQAWLLPTSAVIGPSEEMHRATKKWLLGAHRSPLCPIRQKIEAKDILTNQWAPLLLTCWYTGDYGYDITSPSGDLLSCWVIIAVWWVYWSQTSYLAHHSLTCQLYVNSICYPANKSWIKQQLIFFWAHIECDWANKPHSSSHFSKGLIHSQNTKEQKSNSMK